ncbi:MAG: glycosyltransferase [Candidatus Omnitrophica bacterium]|nr:glycosyltransferase [Candidatus Omnitrophota bacterium]
MIIEDNKKNNLLIISYHYPPIKAMGSLRPFFLAKTLDKAKWNVYVFSSSNYRLLETDKNFQRLATDKNKVNLPTFDLQTIKFFLAKLLKKRNISMRNSMLRMIHSFPFNMFSAGGFLFILTGLLKGLYFIRRYNIRYLFSTYSIYSNHMLAFLLKKFNKDLVWIADFRDLPFGDSYEEILLPSLQRKFNKIIFGKTDYITTVSNGLKERLKKYNSNIEVIRNGIPVDIDPTKKPVKTETFNIVYTGALYYGKRDAFLLFNCLKRLADNKEIGNDFKLIYAGSQGELWLTWAKENNMVENIELLGDLDRDAVLELQNKASINLVLTWSDRGEKGVITGKFYEYLAAGRPILCIINGQKDEEMEKLFKDINVGLVVYNQPPLNRSLESFVKSLYSEWKKKGFVTWEYENRFLNECRYENISREFEKIFLKKEKTQDA